MPEERINICSAAMTGLPRKTLSYSSGVSLCRAVYSNGVLKLTGTATSTNNLRLKRRRPEASL